MIYVQPTYLSAISSVEGHFVRNAKKVHSKYWQGVDISSKPEMATFEALNVSFSVDMNGYDRQVAAEHIKPNLPWANDHFEERVCGQPINPGIQWKKWPYGQHAAKFLEEGKFNHNYMERYWPKQAGMVPEATETADQFLTLRDENRINPEARWAGIKYQYGDLNDVVDLLCQDPYTRQAYLPIFFPEDTGGGAKRAPCTLGYHFIMREGQLHVVYYIRSCDMRRHFRDDVYLTHLLAEWVLTQCKAKDERWSAAVLGTFTMHITSLHVFANDWQAMFPNADRPT